MKKLEGEEMKGKLKIHRTYEMDDCPKGTRILVDRLWPRGIAKDQLKPFEWKKEIAPSTELRKWFHENNTKFSKFKQKYTKELNNNEEKKDFLELVKDQLKKGDVILLYGAKDEEKNNAQVLKGWLEKKIKVNVVKATEI